MTTATTTGWTVTAWHCGCCAVEWRRRNAPPGWYDAAPGRPDGVGGGLFWHNTVDEFLAEHRDIVPVDVDNPRVLLAEVARLTALTRTVDLFGIGFTWTDPATGKRHDLRPSDVTVTLAADQQTEVERLRLMLAKVCDLHGHHAPSDTAPAACPAGSPGPARPTSP